MYAITQCWSLTLEASCLSYIGSNKTSEQVKYDLLHAGEPPLCCGPVFTTCCCSLTPCVLPVDQPCCWNANWCWTWAEVCWSTLPHLTVLRIDFYCSWCKQIIMISSSSDVFFVCCCFFWLVLQACSHLLQVNLSAPTDLPVHHNWSINISLGLQWSLSAQTPSLYFRNLRKIHGCVDLA